MTTEILALPGARTKALLLFVKVSDAHDSTLLLLLVSHTRAEMHTRVWWDACVRARECVRVSSRKCKVATTNALFAVNSTFSSRQGRWSGYFQHLAKCKFVSETVRRKDWDCTAIARWKLRMTGMSSVSRILIRNRNVAGSCDFS